MTKTCDVKNALQGINDDMARDWLKDEVHMKALAVSRDEISEDAGEYLDLQGFLASTIDSIYLARELGIQ